MDADRKTSVISVVGTGHVKAEYKTVKISITIYKTSDTIRQSQDEVNRITDEIIGVIEENEINIKNIHIASIKFEPCFAWQNNSRVYIGQKVEQILVCIIERFGNKVDKIVNILNTITRNTNSIKLSLGFEINKKRKIEIKCRKAAYIDGYRKARKYAWLARLKIIRAIKIMENESAPNAAANPPGDVTENINPSIFMPMGKVEKTMKLSIDFLAKKRFWFLPFFGGSRNTE